MSVGELLKNGNYLDAMEKALFTKLLDKLDQEDWDGCGQVIHVMEGLSII